MVIRNFKAYRGMYEEIMSAPTEDMAFYFAWDTQQFLVGNKNGVKVPYGNCPNVVKKEVNLLLEKFRNEFTEEAKKIAEAKIEKSFDEAFNEATSNINNRLTVLEVFKNETGQNIVLINNKISSIEGDIVGILSTVTELSNTTASLDRRVETLEIKISALEGSEEFDKALGDLQGKIDLVSAEVKEVSKNLENLDSQVDNLETNTTTKFGSLDTTISEIQQSVSNLSSKVDSLEVSQLASRIDELETHVDGINDTMSQNISKLQTDLTNISGNVNTVNSQVSDLESLVETNYNNLSTSISDINDDVSEINNDITEINTGISNINTTLETVNGNYINISSAVSKNTDDINTLNTSISNITSKSTVNYMTGNDITLKLISLNGKLEEFEPTFCILDSSPSDDFIAGSFYYYDKASGEIVAAATGGSMTPTEIISTLSLTQQGSISEEINSSPATLTFRLTVDKMDAIDGAITFTDHLGSSSVVDLSDSSVVVTKTIALDRSQVKSYTVRLSATAKTATKKNTYKVNNASKTYSIYKPHIFRVVASDGTVRKVVKRAKSVAGTYYDIEIQTNDIVEILVPTGTRISAVNDLTMPFPLNKITRDENINGLSITYDVFQSNILKAGVIGILDIKQN